MKTEYGKCRRCSRLFQSPDFYGYCSDACMKDQARRFGWVKDRPGRTIRDFLIANKEFGTIIHCSYCFESGESYWIFSPLVNDIEYIKVIALRGQSILIKSGDGSRRLFTKLQNGSEIAFPYGRRKNAPILYAKNKIDLLPQ